MLNVCSIDGFFCATRWFPNHERATAVGISMGGFQLGNVVGLVVTPIFMASLGISGPFILFTSLGLFWLITWSSRVAKDPQECSYISKSELRLIQSGKSNSQVIKSEFPPLRLLLSKLPSWAIILANITNNWVRFFYAVTLLFLNFALEVLYSFLIHCRDTLYFYHGCLFILRQ